MRSERRRATLDERTDRLARRRDGFPLERDTYRWASLRFGVASHDLERSFRREVLPEVDKLNAAAVAATKAMKRFGEALRRIHDE